MNEKQINNQKDLDINEKLKILSEDLVKFKFEAAENWELFIKAKAEIENLKKKNEKEISNSIKYSNKKILLDLLPVLDSLESCLENEKHKNEKFYIGLNLIYKMLFNALNKNGIQKIDVKKYTNFDPTKHEAISIINSDIYDNKILSVFQSGYMFHNQVIRYSKVSIFKKQ